MKNLPEEIHVEALNAAHGAEIIQTFKKLGIATGDCEGTVNKKDGGICRYYGIWGSEFKNRIGYNLKNVVTLDELKSYLEEDIPELPNGILMYVSDSPITPENEVPKRFVFGKRDGQYLAWTSADTSEEIVPSTTSWRYAQAIDTLETIMTVAEIEEKLGITNLKITK